MFRAGANFVRVDVFASKDGVPVEDLKAEDFDVSEDGARADGRDLRARPDRIGR